MGLRSQLILGNIGNIAGFGFGLILILMAIPMLVWLIVSVVRWRRGSRRTFRWWGITAITLFGLGIVIYTFAKTFSGGPYAIASEVGIHVPMSVHVLENDSSVAFDGSESYTVVQFNDSQMRTFISAAKRKGWKLGSAAPYSLLDVPAGDSPMSDKAKPLPKTDRTGYYYASVQRSNKEYDGVGGYVNRKVYFADVTSKILYVYSYQGQGP